jgi:Endosomal/lysosomal potassium channel TMEM175
MEKNRLEASRNGVLAIIITIMVLELKAPHGGQFLELSPLELHWNNHPRGGVSARMLWANLHLLSLAGEPGGGSTFLHEQSSSNGSFSSQLLFDYGARAPVG